MDEIRGSGCAWTGSMHIMVMVLVGFGSLFWSLVEGSLDSNSLI